MGFSKTNLYTVGLLLLVINFLIIPWNFSSISPKSGAEYKRFDAGYALFFSPPIIPPNEIRIIRHSTLSSSGYKAFRGHRISQMSARIDKERLAIQTIVIVLVLAFFVVIRGKQN